MDAMVRLTAAPEVVPTEEAEEYEMVDLRRDIILMCHDNRPHLSLGRTLQQLRELCYWSTLATKNGRDSVQKHMSMCKHCITRPISDAGMVYHHILNFRNPFLSFKKRRRNDRQQVGTAGHRGDDRRCR